MGCGGSQPPARRPQRRPDPPAARRALQQTFRVRPARVHTCSRVRGASHQRGSRSLACPGSQRVPRAESASPPPDPPRGRRLPSSASGISRHHAGSRERLRRSPPPRRPQIPEDAPAPGGRVHTTQRRFLTEPRPHRPRLTGPHRARTRTQTPRQPLSVCVCWRGVRGSGGGPVLSRRPRLLTLPAPSRSCPGGAVSFTHFAILSMAKENIINPLSATWLPPNLPLLLFFRPFGQYSTPAAGRWPGGSRQARPAEAGRGLGRGRGRGGRGTRAPAALPREAVARDQRSCSGS